MNLVVRLLSSVLFHLFVYLSFFGIQKQLWLSDFGKLVASTPKAIVAFVKARTVIAYCQYLKQYTQ